MSGGALALELAPGVAVEWDAAALRALSGDALTEEASPWSLRGEPGPAHSALRVLSAALTDGSQLVLAALRPANAEGHDAERVQAALVRDGEPRLLHEALVSTEYAADGRARRVGLELYEERDGYPLRGAGDAISGGSRTRDGWTWDSAALRFRLDGRGGTALYEILHRV